MWNPKPSLSKVCPHALTFASFACMSLFAPQTSSAQATDHFFVRDADIRNEHEIEHVEKTADGGFIITGRAVDAAPSRNEEIWLAKFDNNNNIIWQIFFGTPTSDERGIHVQQISQNAGGGFILAFRSDFDPLQTQGLARFTNNGVLQWTRILPSTAPVSSPVGIVVRELMTNTGFITCGEAQSGVNDPRAVTHVVNLAGALVAQQLWSGGPNDLFQITRITDITPVPATSDYIFSGTAQAIATFPPAQPIEYERAMAFRATLPNFTINWAFAYGPTWLQNSQGTFSESNGAALNPNNQLFLNGSVTDLNDPNNGYSGMFVTRIAANTGLPSWWTSIVGYQPASAAIQAVQPGPFLAANRSFGDGGISGNVLSFMPGTGTLAEKHEYVPELGQLALNSRFNTLGSVVGPNGWTWLPAGQTIAFGPANGAYFVRSQADGSARCFVTTPSPEERAFTFLQNALTPVPQVVQGSTLWDAQTSQAGPGVNPITCTVQCCGLADVGSQGGVIGCDGNLDNNDFAVFLTLFFAADPRADVGSQGGIPGSDGLFNNNDFAAFITLFFEGCTP